MNRELEEALQIRYVKLHFTIAFVQDTTLPRYKVSALRGGMGEMLLRANCVRDRKCENCDFVSECVVQRTMYSEFEKKPNFVTSGKSVGYVIECNNYKENFLKGDTMEFQLILFGKNIVYFNSYLQAFHALGMQGLGKNQSRFQIVNIRNSYKQPILDGNDIFMERYEIHRIADYVKYRLQKMQKKEDRYELTFYSPLSMKYQGEPLAEFNMEAIIRALKRRIYMLDCFEGIDGEAAFALEFKVPQIRQQLIKKTEVRRFSARKEQAMYLSGIYGSVELEEELEFPQDVLALLLAGELTHLGSNTSFGFGEYIVK